ncbi:MAG: cytochrome c, partial [Flavobacteriaceae bacterium]|nr:cytochrome c [Flavobacteriaceae bacterium]
MSDLKYSFLALASMIVLASCSDKNSRNYQYMPNMYESVGYETYQEVAFLPSNMEAG